MIIKILNSSLLLLLGSIISRMIMFIVNIFAARMLAQETFGAYMFLRSTISMFDGIISISFGNITVKRVSEYANKNTQLKEYIFSLFIVNLILVFLIALLIFLFSDEILFYFFLNDQSLQEPLYISLFILLASVMASLAQKINIGLANYKEIAILSTGNLLFGLPLVLYLVNKYKLNGLLWGVALYFLIDFFLKTLIYIKKQKIFFFTRNKKRGVFKKNIRYLFSSSSILIVSAIISSFAFWAFRLNIVNKSNNFSNIASFDVAYQWVVVIMLITGSTTSVALQMFSGEDKNKIKIFRINLIINLVIATLFSIVFSCFAREIMSLYGQVYIKSYYLIYIVCILTIFATVDSIYNKLFISNNDTLIIVINTIISTLVSLCFLLVSQEKDLSLQLAITFLLYYFSFFILDTLYILKNYTEFFINKRKSHI